MLSHAAKEMSYSWGFGVHEALDQSGALFGPLLLAFVWSAQKEYRLAFLTLFIPAIICLTLLLIARSIYPRPEEMEPLGSELKAKGLSTRFWVYLAGAVLVSAGFADFSIMAFHFQRTAVVPQSWDTDLLFQRNGRALISRRKRIRKTETAGIPHGAVAAPFRFRGLKPRADSGASLRSRTNCPSQERAFSEIENGGVLRYPMTGGYQFAEALRLLKYLLVLGGGGIGSLVRFTTGTAIMARFGGTFPLGLRLMDILGATVYRGILGYGAKGHTHKSHRPIGLR